MRRLLSPFAVVIALLLPSAAAFAQPQIHEVLHERAKLIAKLVGESNGQAEWWAGYNGTDDLEVWKWDDTFVDYIWPAHRNATLSLYSIQAIGVQDAKESEPVELDSVVIDAASIEVSNSGSQSEQSWEYMAEFETLTTKEHSFELGFEQSLTVTGTIGSDGVPGEAGDRRDAGLQSNHD